MKFKYTLSAVLSIIILLALIIPACSPGPTEPADGYAAVIPAILPAGSQQSVSVTLFKGEQTVSGSVELTLFDKDKKILSVERSIRGKGTIPFNVPDVAEGDYTIRIKGNGFEDEADIRIENNYLIFLETDKPIYKPGQTIQMRVFTLDAELKPLSNSVTIEVLDAKGIKVFRQESTTDDWGMATLSLPLSSEPNLGVWKISAASPNGKTELDIRVEKYVLPKYEVKLVLPKQWFLADEEIKGKVTSEYSFGKPVSGELEIRASRYVGVWEEYSVFKADIDGETEFTIPAAGYVAGVPAAGGQGNVMLEASVLEKTTGYEEKTSALLTVARSELNLQIIPSGVNFKPGLPFSFLVVTETPDNTLVDKKVNVNVTFVNNEFEEIGKLDKSVNTVNGKVMMEITPPAGSAALRIQCASGDAMAEKSLEASYSPSGNFIHVEQASQGTPGLGDTVSFRVYSTQEAANFYYEVVSRGKVVFTDYVKNTEISFTTTPLMAPTSRLLVYQILPSSEVAADYIPFNVDAQYPQDVKVEFDKTEVRPGEEVKINIDAEGKSKVGITAVDRSVFILAENRLNLQQVFDELEKLYMEPQAEIHEVNIYTDITNPGSDDVFRDAGVIMLTDKKLTEGKEYKQPVWNVQEGLGRDKGAIAVTTTATMTTTPAPTITLTAPAPVVHGPGQVALAEVQRVRQFFPETWLWQEVLTDSDGQASLEVNVPDTITTWMLRAVAMSKDKGLGVAETELRVFQPFFLSVDLPYSVIRGEEFPVRVAVYNYLDRPQSVQVEIEEADWFELLDSPVQTVEIAASDIGSAEFMIKPIKLGQNSVKITARSAEAADAVVKDLLIDPEGVSREEVQNISLEPGATEQLTTDIPSIAIDGSGRAYLTITSSYLTQTIEGLEGLIQMPFGCGEQNMMFLAPDVFITKYLEASGQIKPEVMARAEMLMLTGYQRELTYRHSDGSFSAFGESDPEGSLWLTAFVLKSFAQADGLIYIDSQILKEAKNWIVSHQNSDGSFDAVGSICHQEILGGLSGKNALTAYVAIALMEAGDISAASKAVAYLEEGLEGIDDAYTMALAAYALELGGSPLKDKTHEQLMSMAREDENGLHWGEDIVPLQEEKGLTPPRFGRETAQTATIENTGYAALALVAHGDMLNASRAAKWLVSKRNAFGGFGSTQDTVVALEALTEFGSGSRADIDLKVTIETSEGMKEVSLKKDNFDVLQVVAVPVDDNITVTTTGKGDAIAQLVKRYNLPEAESPDEEILKIDVNYDASEVEVNDLINVSVEVSFNPPIPMEAGMTVLDISIPTGFTPVTESIDALMEKDGNMKRYDIAGRKVIFYIENLLPGDTLDFSFQAQAMYPVKAKGVSSKAYSYYQPEISGETLSSDIVVR